MKYNILNTHTGEITRISFESKEQVETWIEDCTGFVNLGPCTEEYFTRHQRMNISKDSNDKEHRK